MRRCGRPTPASSRSGGGALLAAAEAADTAVQLASRQMGAIAVRLQANLIVTAGSRLSDAYLTIGAATTGRAPGAARARDAAATARGGDTATAAGGGNAAATAAGMAELVRAADDLQAGRDLPTDYRALGTAHTRLIAALRTPRGDTAAATADLKTFLALLQAAETATKGG